MWFIIFVAGIIRGFTGFGSALIAVPTLAYLYGPAAAVVIEVLIEIPVVLYLLPAAIRAAVMSGCPDAIEVGDRAEAILRGIDALGPGDALLIAGKGHETYQDLGDTTIDFDDRLVARQELQDAS